MTTATILSFDSLGGIKNITSGIDPEVLKGVSEAQISASLIMEDGGFKQIKKSSEELFFDSVEARDVLPFSNSSSLSSALGPKGREELMNNSMTESLQLIKMFTIGEHIEMARVIITSKRGSMYTFLLTFLNEGILSREVLAIIVPYLREHDRENLELTQSYLETKSSQGNSKAQQVLIDFNAYN